MYRNPSSSMRHISDLKSRKKGPRLGRHTLVLLINAAHQSCGRRQDLINENEDGLLGRKLDALADNIDELADGEVGGDKILLLVNSGDVGFFNLLADDRDAV